MPRTMRSAAKAGKQANAEQEPNPRIVPLFAGGDTEVATDRSEVAKTPTKAMPPPATMSSKKRKRFSTTTWPWTHERPTVEVAAQQVRNSGRNLIPWQRPRMVEKFLLNLEYECTRQGIAVPWDDIAHRFHPGATAAGVLQHFARLRSVMAAEGHLIPPKIPTKKERGPVDSTIRGYLRKEIDKKNGAVVVRSVKYTEPLENPTYSRADAYDMGAYEDDDTPEGSARKAQRRGSIENGGPGSASKSTGSRRRTRVPIKYEDVTEPESESEDDEDEDPEAYIPLDERPIRDDVDLEELATSLYTRNMNPRVLASDPTPTYFVHGEFMDFKQVCAKAIRLYQHFGYQDPECGRIIAEHRRHGPPPPLAHFPHGNFEHPISQYPALYRPVPTRRGGPVNTMSPLQNNLGMGSNDNNMGYNQPAPVTPTGNSHASVGLFGRYNNTGGSLGSSRGINIDFGSPIEIDEADDGTSPNGYRPLTDYITPTEWPTDENDGLPIDYFSTYRLGHNAPGNVGRGMNSGVSNNQAFNTATYSHHMTAGQVNPHAGHNSGSSLGTNNVDNLSNNPFARSLSNINSGNAGSVPGPIFSATSKARASPEDNSMPEPPSTSELRPLHEPVMDEHHFDEQFDHFALVDHPDTDNGTH